MNSDPDQLLNRLVVAAVTVFVIVSLLLAAFVVREIWLQQRIAGLSSDLQVNIEDLQETTEDIQSEMSENRTTTAEAEEIKGRDDITELLENVDQQLELIGENIDEVGTVRETESQTATVDSKEGEAEGAVGKQADQVFTIFTVLMSLAAIAIAVLLGKAMRVQEHA